MNTEIFNKPLPDIYTPEQKTEVKVYLKAQRIEVFYCINFNPLAKVNKRSFCLVYDFDPDSCRGGKGLRNNMGKGIHRSLSEIELDDVVANFDVFVKRFYIMRYKSLSNLIADDNRCGVVTPFEAIVLAKENKDIIEITE